MTPPKNAQQKAVQILSRREYSTLELRRKLTRGYSAQEIQLALERLQEIGLLDDERLALERARSGREGKLWGDLKLRAYLARIGIDDRIAERVLKVIGEDLGEAESLDRLTAKWLKIHGAPVSHRQMKRLFDYCLRRGYPPDLVRTKLEAWWSGLGSPAE